MFCMDNVSNRMMDTLNESSHYLCLLKLQEVGHTHGAIHVTFWSLRHFGCRLLSCRLDLVIQPLDDLPNNVPLMYKNVNESENSCYYTHYTIGLGETIHMWACATHIEVCSINWSHHFECSSASQHCITNQSIKHHPPCRTLFLVSTSHHLSSIPPNASNDSTMQPACCGSNGGVKTTSLRWCPPAAPDGSCTLAGLGGDSACGCELVYICHGACLACDADHWAHGGQNLSTPKYTSVK